VAEATSLFGRRFLFEARNQEGRCVGRAWIRPKPRKGPLILGRLLFPAIEAAANPLATLQNYFRFDLSS
jgi:hypothetical protein